MDKLDYQIADECEIKNKLAQLERGRIYVLSGAQMDGYLATNVEQLRKMISELLSKIQNGQDGTATELGEIMRNL